MDQATQPNSNQALAEAYTQAQAEIQNVVKNAENPHFKSSYADLGAVIDTVKPVFAKYGLAVFQSPGKLVELEGGNGLAVSLVNVLMHKSGAMLNVETQLPLGPKATAQAAGGAITYARRYALAAIAGIAQVDDDGNGASGRGARDDDAPEVEGVDDAIEAATTLEELEELKEAAQATGNKKTVDKFLAKRKALKKAGK